MADVIGAVTPGQAGRLPFQRDLGAGIWNMEYVLLRDGVVVDCGSLNANRDGTFALRVGVPRGLTVRIRCLGGWGYHTAEVEARVADPTGTVDCGTLVMRAK